MHRIHAVSLILCLWLCIPALGADLYRVTVTGHEDADLLNDIGVDPVLLVNDGYLVLVEPDQRASLEASGVRYSILARDISRDRLALDHRIDDKNIVRYPVLYEEDEVRLLLVDSDKTGTPREAASLFPLKSGDMTIRYREPMHLNASAVFQTQGLQELIDKVSYDSVYQQLHHLQAYDGRIAGTWQNRDARDWLMAKFQSYGYSQTWLHSFYAYVYTGWTQCYNVVAYKQGTVYPDRQIVIGAHFDAVEYSPGVDDNGTGTVGVLEIARALADVETEMSIVLIAFDAEEWGLYGAWAYADQAAAQGDSIICMLNMDMIGHYTNQTLAYVKYGPVDAYARLWIELADSLVGINGVLGGYSSRSDHYAFQQNGYDVLFAQEYSFSTVYHTHRDSTSYINFDYCTKLIKATLATAYTINEAPIPVEITSVFDGGDGQSLSLEWSTVEPGEVAQYTIFYGEHPDGPADSMAVPGNVNSVILTGLTQGQEYYLYVAGVDAEGDQSLVFNKAYGTPEVLPAAPHSLSALPDYHAIRLSWAGNNTELDFSHYTVIRDGELLPANVTGFEYIDNDYSLGSDFHDYLVVAVDSDGNISDTVGVEPVTTRAATLEPGRILAINRSSKVNQHMVNEAVTGEFLNEALGGYDYVYVSDTAAGAGDDSLKVDLMEMIDYEVIVVGGESGRNDDLLAGGLLDTIGMYLDVGGKVIVFGRWGDLSTGDIADTVIFSTTTGNKSYETHFHMDMRIEFLTSFVGTTLLSDLVGVHGQIPEYPDLAWDSLATVNHSAPWTDAGGIPCPSFVVMGDAAPEIIYTYDSRDDYSFSEGRPVGWRYHGTDYDYVFFEFPLSFMDRTSAVGVLQTALAELSTSGPAAATVFEPDTLDLTEDPPATVTICLGDFSDGKTAGDVDQSTVLVNDDLIPATVSVLPSHPSFAGDALEIVLSTDDFAAGYRAIVGTVDKVYTVSWKYTGEPGSRIIFGVVTIIDTDFIAGDANGDYTVNIADAVYVIDYIFKGGPPPEPLEVGDFNCDGGINVGDAVYLINYIFRDGPPPGC